MTNAMGRWNTCGLTPGRRARAAVFGPRGAMLGNTALTLNAGLNIMAIQIRREPGAGPRADGENPMPMRRRPRQ
jgi:hypothetical protein